MSDKKEMPRFVYRESRWERRLRSLAIHPRMAARVLFFFWKKESRKNLFCAFGAKAFSLDKWLKSLVFFHVCYCAGGRARIAVWVDLPGTHSGAMRVTYWTRAARPYNGSAETK